MSAPLARAPFVASAEQAVAFRVARAHLARRERGDRLVPVVRRLVGLQAQLPSAAALAAWARVEGATPGRFADAIYSRRALTRTWSLRGTAHVLAREDRALVVRALGPEVGGLRRALVRRGVVTEKKLSRARETVLEALSDGPLARSEIARALARTGAKALTGSWGGIMKLLALEGLVVFGPPRGAETTFVRSDRWFPGRADPAPANALASLLERYLVAFAPATLADFSYWSGVPVVRAREAARELASSLDTVRVDGRELLILERDKAALGRARSSSRVRLLPAFDVFLLGHKDKSLSLDPAHAKAVFRAAGWVSPVILVRGRARGTWEHELSGSRLEVALHPFGPLSRGERAALGEEAQSLARALGATRIELRS